MKDPMEAAADAAVHAFLNCAMRESDAWRVVAAEDATGPAAEAVTPGCTAVATIPLRSGRMELLVGIRYLSPTQRHRFALPARLSVAGGPAEPVSLTTLASLLADELAADTERQAATTNLLERLLDSVHAVAGYLEQRGEEVERLWSAEPLRFLESEQALLLGHMVHPTPKSRGEMSPADRQAMSPETQGAFALHWLAVEPDLVRHASATGTPAPELVRALLRTDPAVDGGALDAALRPLGERTLVPAHPWEAQHLRRQPELADLYESGAVVDLGPLGAPVTPTTSVRTVYRGDWPWQLKFSLHLRITNSMRVTLPKELDRAVEAATLARTAIGTAASAAAPNFVFVHDPAHLTLQRDGEVLDGFSVLLRENHWLAGNRADVSAVTTLCQDHPFGGRSRLGNIVARLAADAGRPDREVGREWFARFCEVAVVSLVRLYADVGLCFEAHAQNSLLELDGGWPARIAYRDSQGYFHRELAHDDLTRVVPGLGEATESIFPEDLADERLVYYLFLNLTLGVVNALGVAGVADETELLADLRKVLEAERARTTRYPTTLVDRLLDDDSWPCKANLRTRLHDMDELVGDIATQSVYVTIPNPLRESR